MKKLLLLVLAIIACLTFVACDGDWTSTVTDFSGSVSSNGGFLVQKGDYVYFVNGVETNTAENAFGKPVKGAIVRAKTADIAKGNATAEVVIPEVVFSQKMDNDNGIFIFGDNVYYATPCNAKNKDGDIRYTELEYMSTKLDGTSSKVIATIASLNDEYRFVEIKGVVYLVVVNTNADSETKIIIYNASTCKKVLESAPLTSYVLPDDITEKYAFYATAIHNELLDEDESFNAINRIALDGSSDVQVLNGAGTYTDATYGIGIAGAKFETVRFTGADLYIKETSVETSSFVNYKGIKAEDLTTEKVGEKPATRVNYDALTTIDNGSSMSAQIFASSSIYVNLNSIIYFDATYGIMKYNHANAQNQAFGREKVYYNKDILGATFKFIDNGVCYFASTDGYYYSLNLADIIDLTTGDIKADADKVLPKQLNYFKFNTAWYQPEIVGDLMFVCYDKEPFANYVYAIDLTATNGMTEEQIEEYETELNKESRETLTAKQATLVGIMNSADKKAFTEYVDNNYPQKEETSASNN